MNLHKATLDYRQIQRLSDEIEMHLRSLEAMSERLQDGFVINLYKSNLPQEAISILELQRGEEEWTLQLFRKKLNLYLKSLVPDPSTKPDSLPPFKPNNFQSNCFQHYRTPFRQPAPYNQSGGYRTAHTMVSSDSNFASSASNFQSANNHGPAQRCIYCGGTHWSDQCTEYATIDARKERIKGSCYVCLKQDHNNKNCTSPKACFYCRTVGDHH